MRRTTKDSRRKTKWTRGRRGGDYSTNIRPNGSYYDKWIDGGAFNNEHYVLVTLPWSKSVAVMSLLLDVVHHGRFRGLTPNFEIGGRSGSV